MDGSSPLIDFVAFEDYPRVPTTSAKTTNSGQFSAGIDDAKNVLQCVIFILIEVCEGHLVGKILIMRTDTSCEQWTKEIGARVKTPLHSSIDTDYDTEKRTMKFDQTQLQFKYLILKTRLNTGRRRTNRNNKKSQLSANQDKRSTIRHCGTFCHDRSETVKKCVPKAATPTN